MPESRSRTPVYLLLALGVVVIVLVIAGVVAFRVEGPRQYTATSESMAPTIEKGDRFRTKKINNAKTSNADGLLFSIIPIRKKNLKFIPSSNA